MKKQNIRQLVKNEIKQISEDFEYQYQTKKVKRVEDPAIKESFELKLSDILFHVRFFTTIHGGIPLMFYNFLPKNSAGVEKAKSDQSKTLLKSIENYIYQKTKLKAQYERAHPAAGLTFRVQFDDIVEHMEKMLK